MKEYISQLVLALYVFIRAGFSSKIYCLSNL